MGHGTSMSHVTVERNGRTFHVQLAKVQDVIDLMDANYARRRKELIEDLEAMKASPEDKMKALAELRDRKGLTADLMREAFTLEGACSIIRHMANPDDYEAVIDGAPDKIVELALLVLGFTLDAEGDDPEEGSDADPQMGGETSTKRQ